MHFGKGGIFLNNLLAFFPMIDRIFVFPTSANFGSLCLHLIKSSVIVSQSFNFRIFHRHFYFCKRFVIFLTFVSDASTLLVFFFKLFMSLPIIAIVFFFSHQFLSFSYIPFLSFAQGIEGVNRNCSWLIPAGKECAEKGLEKF